MMTNYDYALQDLFLAHARGETTDTIKLKPLVELGYLTESLELTEEGKSEASLLRNGYYTAQTKLGKETRYRETNS